MSWSTLLRHCSAASGKASGPGGLWRSVHVAASMPSGPTAGGDIVAMVGERWRCVVAAEAIAAVVMWPLVRRDRPALERGPCSGYK
jgi:hypothetical protein